MRTTILSRKLIPFILPALILIGCQDPFFQKQSSTGDGTFTLNIQGIQAGRTILPSPTINDFPAYTLVFSASGMEPITLERSAADIGDAVILSAGTWNLTVTAYMDETRTKLAAQGSITGIVITNGANVSRSVELKANMEIGATGTFRWKIDYLPAITVASMAITPLDTDTGTPEMLVYFTGGTPSVDKNNSASPLELNTGYYKVTFRLNNGQYTIGRTEYLHIYKNMESYFEYAFVESEAYVRAVTNNADSGPGSLRQAVEDLSGGGTILIAEGVGTISLESSLLLRNYSGSKLTIIGNGVTITRSPSYLADVLSPLITIWQEWYNVSISRVHFKDGRTYEYAAAIWNRGTLELESCIFSGNESKIDAGAIMNSNTMTVKGCTFYNNTASLSYGGAGAIYNLYGCYLTLVGNLFYGNTAIDDPIVYCTTPFLYITPSYNVVDVPFGSGNGQSGWSAGTGDKFINTLPLSTVNFKLISGGGAETVIATRPADYPTEDFYGNPIPEINAAAGAVQSMASGSGYMLDVGVNNSLYGSVSVEPAPNEDGLVSGTVTVTAISTGNAAFLYWEKDGNRIGNTNPLTLTITNHTKLKAVFQQLKLVTNFTDAPGSSTTPGTLRYALSAVESGDIIRFVGVTPGVTTIALTEALPPIAEFITIEGNGITLTRDPSWTTVDVDSQLLVLWGYGGATISRVHFKDGRAAHLGGAIRNHGLLNLESCIFSGNQTTLPMEPSIRCGGAIGNYGTAIIKGCTFYNNSSAGEGGAICNISDSYREDLILTGNLFYGNTAALNPVVAQGSTSEGFNVIEVPYGGRNNTGIGTQPNDKIIIGGQPLLSPVNFKLASGSEAANVIDTLPAGYPTVDFYGNPITNGAAAGAVQSTASGSGYVLEVTVNNNLFGSVGIQPLPDAEGIVSGTITAAASPVSGYSFAYWLQNGNYIGTANPVSVNITEHTKLQAVFANTLLVTSSGDTNTPGTFRYALSNAQTNDLIRFSGVSSIALTGTLPEITGNMVIEGNGVTLTRDPSWTTIDDDTQLLRIGSAAIVNITRIHFKDGKATYDGAAIYNRGALTLESCIFSENQNTTSGGAISNQKIMTIKGCTFYLNSSAGPAGYAGGAIYQYSSDTLTLQGNLFYGNTASRGPVVYQYFGTVISNGYNVVDVPFGTGDTQCGWVGHVTDKQSNTLTVSPKTFRHISGSGVANVITTLPAGYPTVDFYGEQITNNAAAGAVQSQTSGYPLELTVNDSSRGSVSVSPQPNADDLYTEAIFTPSPAAGWNLAYWLVDGNMVTDANPLVLILKDYTQVQAVFGKVFTVSIFTDNASNSSTTVGTLRHALTNAGNGDIVRIGTSGQTISLTSRLSVSGNIAIDGNSLTLTKAAAWTTTDTTSQLLYVDVSDSSTSLPITIRRVHFKDGRAGFGAAIYNYRGNLSLESCIFSGNQTSNGGLGGAIDNGGTMTIKGCTFSSNSTNYQGGAIYSGGSNSILTLQGNLFNGNTASTGPVVYRNSGTVTSKGYNVVNVPLGTGNSQSGWTAHSTDKTLGDLGITGAPFNTTTFVPVTELQSVIPLPAPVGFPTTDFNGNTRYSPGAPGAVR